MDVLSKLGIDIRLLIAQIINFGILLWLLNMLLYKPVVKRIEKDEQELTQATLLKESLEKEKEALENKRKKTIQDSKKESEKIISEAEQISKRILTKARLEAREEKEAVVDQIKTRLADITHETPKKTNTSS